MASPLDRQQEHRLAIVEARLNFHAAILKYLGDHMASQEELDAAVASLNESITTIDEKSTSTQESVDAIQVELDRLNAQVAAGQPVDLTGLNQAVANAQQEATDLSALAADAASSLATQVPPDTGGGGGDTGEPPHPDNTLPNEIPVEGEPPVVDPRRRGR